MAHSAQARTPRRPNISRPTRLSRTALRRLIAQKISTLDVADLRRLASDLRVPLPDESANAPGQTAGAPQAASKPLAEASDAKVPLDLAGRGVGPLVTLEQGAANLDAATRDDPSTDWVRSDLLGAGQMAERLNVSRATLDNWRTAAKAIAFRKGVRNYVYPARQFERFGPVEGLDRVLAHFATAEDAWEWLVTPNRHTNNEAPLDRLKARHFDEVEHAAQGTLDFA